MRRLTAWAESCVFDKQSFGPLRCGRSRLGGQAPPPGPAPLLPKLRGSFAEFLYHGSPDRLGMFYPPTCVGLRYGPRAASLGVFLGSMGSPTSLSRFVRRLGPLRRAFHCAAPYAASRGRPEPRPATLLRRPIGQAPRRWCRNVHLLCIGYAFRPRLSTRLTLGGLALPRKPWVYGGGVTLAALVTHASILTSGRSTTGRPRGFSAGRKAPLPIVQGTIPPLRCDA